MSGLCGKPLSLCHYRINVEEEACKEIPPSTSSSDQGGLGSLDVGAADPRGCETAERWGRCSPARTQQKESCLYFQGLGGSTGEEQGRCRRASKDTSPRTTHTRRDSKRWGLTQRNSAEPSEARPAGTGLVLLKGLSVRSQTQERRRRATAQTQPCSAERQRVLSPANEAVGADEGNRARTQWVANSSNSLPLRGETG